MRSHESNVRILTEARNKYLSTLFRTPRIQWSVSTDGEGKGYWKLQSPAEALALGRFITTDVVPGRRWKAALFSSATVYFVDQGIKSVLDIGTGPGVFPAILSAASIRPYAIEPREDIFDFNKEWLEFYNFLPTEHLFAADLKSFVDAIKDNPGEFFVDCVAWTGTLHGLRFMQNPTEEFIETLHIFFQLLPTICNHFMLSGDLVLGAMLKHRVLASGHDFKIAQVFPTLPDLPAGCQVDHHIISFFKILE